jgi:glycosyltransferase involved in cell wall biosynthesis
VIRNAISIIRSSGIADRLAIRKSILENPSRTLLISVGRLSPPKGYQDLIDAFEIVHRKHPATALAIVGEGSLENSLRDQIASKNLQNDVKLLGLRNDVSDLLAASDIYVSSSHWEGMPISILEGMACGLPVVATSVGEIPALIENCGMTVEPRKPEMLAEAICMMLDSPSKRSHWGIQAQHHVNQHFGSNAWMDRVLKLYLEVCKREAA